MIFLKQKEILEETGCSVFLIPRPKQSTHYTMPSPRTKARTSCLSHSDAQELFEGEAQQ